MRVRTDVEQRHDAAPESLHAAVARRLGVALEAVEGVEVVRRALDARAKRATPTWRLTVDVLLRSPPRRRRKGQTWSQVPPVPEPLRSPRMARDRPVVVVGAGPAGLFAAWHLAEHGARVLLLERGKPVETRARDFGRFRGRGELDPESNICFGEGGAGTYSDGKLYTRKKDPLIPEVLGRMVRCGAPARIGIDAKPHIGTNLLFRMLKGIRAELEALGVTLRFQTKVTGLRRVGGRVTGVRLSGGEILDAGAVVLAIGHSARDTFEALLEDGIPMEPKPFAVGVRAEHPQALIDAAQYGLPGAGQPVRDLRASPRPSTLPPADYRLAAQVEDDRGVWSFCMCPGGMIVPTSTEPDMVVVNGMSSARRSTPFANSGLVVHVGLEDLEREGHRGPLAGVSFQRSLEEAAFRAGGGGYFAPAMRAADLVSGRSAGRLAETHFRPGLTPVDLREVLPAFVSESLAAGLARFDHTLPGYASTDANLIAVESRTSSPIRIPRDHLHQVAETPGLFVAGEGPGYAGGIMSAAIDGLRTADGVLRST